MAQWVKYLVQKHKGQSSNLEKPHKGADEQCGLPASPMQETKTDNPQDKLGSQTSPKTELSANQKPCLKR